MVAVTAFRDGSRELLIHRNSTRSSHLSLLWAVGTALWETFKITAQNNLNDDMCCRSTIYASLKQVLSD